MKKEYEDILNDGWADDVVLGSDRPADTAGDAAQGNSSTCIGDSPDTWMSAVHSSSVSPEGAEDGSLPESSVAGPVRRKNGFRLFLLLWCFLLIVVSIYLLSLLHSYVVKYQAASDEADPDRAASELLAYFRVPDAQALLNMATALPETEEFATDDRSLETLSDLLLYRQISYVHADDATDEVPVYWIYADDVIVARAVYRKKPQADGPYGFPRWYLSELEFFLPTQEAP